MNYIERDAELIRQQIPDGTEIPAHSEALFRAYAVLMRAKGANTRCDDVHDAWRLGSARRTPTMKLLVLLTNSMLKHDRRMRPFSRQSSKRLV